jgi:hypothetical protein
MPRWGACMPRWRRPWTWSTWRPVCTACRGWWRTARWWRRGGSCSTGMSCRYCCGTGVGLRLHCGCTTAVLRLWGRGMVQYYGSVGRQGCGTVPGRQADTYYCRCTAAAAWVGGQGVVHGTVFRTPCRCAIPLHWATALAVTWCSTAWQPGAPPSKSSTDVPCMQLGSLCPELSQQRQAPHVSYLSACFSRDSTR